MLLKNDENSKVYEIITKLNQKGCNTVVVPRGSPHAYS